MTKSPEMSLPIQVDAARLAIEARNATASLQFAIRSVLVLLIVDYCVKNQVTLTQQKGPAAHIKREAFKGRSDCDLIWVRVVTS